MDTMDKFLQSLICRHTFNTQELINSYPPKIHNKNKQIVYNKTCSPGSEHNGNLIFSRWNAMPIPAILSISEYHTEFEQKNGYFDYKTSENRSKNNIEWYLNFAAQDLFYAYGGSLFAQDEMQVTEHPALASLREALIDAEIKTYTVENRKPTPILIRGVERRCAIAIEPNSTKGRPVGLYGNNFAKATPKAIEQAIEIINPPSITNILAIEAPSYGFGIYSQKEIKYILTTAFTGFVAAKIESWLEIKRLPKVIIHTGFWGCGAYGGNRVLMVLLQLLAASLSQIDRLVFHIGDTTGIQAFINAQEIFEQLVSNTSSVEIYDVLEKIYAMKFQWGVSDGN